MILLLFKSKNRKVVIFGVEISFLGGKLFFKFQILLNEAKTHPNQMYSYEFYSMTKKMCSFPYPYLKLTFSLVNISKNFK